MNKLKIIRVTALLFFGLGLVSVIFNMVNGNILLSRIFAWFVFTGLMVFTFTEAFLFKPPLRSKFGIIAARIYFIMLIFVVLGLTASFIQMLIYGT